MRYQDRREAGRKLGARLTILGREPGLLVLALPRGGVPVAWEVARALHAPLDVFLVRKLGLPGHEELAMGAIASGGVRLLNQDLVGGLGVPQGAIDAVTAKEECELERRERAYRQDRPRLDLAGRTVILIDDGLATGATMRAALQAARKLRPRRLIVAVPVASPAACRTLRAEADAVVCDASPDPVEEGGAWYAECSPPDDAEVRDLLELAAAAERAAV